MIDIPELRKHMNGDAHALGCPERENMIAALDELEEWRNPNRIASSIVHSCCVDYAEAKKQIKAWQRRTEAKEAENTTLYAELKRQSTRVGELETDLETANESIAEYESGATLLNMRVRINNLNAQLDNTQLELARVKAENSRLKSEIKPKCPCGLPQDDSGSGYCSYEHFNDYEMNYSNLRLSDDELPKSNDYTIETDGKPTVLVFHLK